MHNPSPAWPFVAALLLNFLSDAPAAPTVEKLPDGVQVTTDAGMTRLQVWSDQIIRVTSAPGKSLPSTKSLSIVSRPQKTSWTLRETPDAIGLKTAALEAKVDRKTGAVAFTDAAGRLLTEEAATGRKFAPSPVAKVGGTSVEQAFALPPDEHIYGLGQHQAGAWDYRGTAVRLLQRNMEVGIPVLVSSRGYGILWDNPAVTDVRVDASPLAPIPADQLFDRDGKPGGLTAEYFSGAHFETLVATRAEARLDFDWAKTPPLDPPAEKLSVRWAGEIAIKAGGDYTFAVEAKDGVRLTIDDQPVIDEWTWRPQGLLEGRIHLAANSRHRLRLEVFNGGGGGGELHLQWRLPTTIPLVTWTSEVGRAVDYYFLGGPSLDDVIAGYRTLTGPAPMMPRWLWGFWQCKERYKSQAEFLGIAAEYRGRGVPIDGLIQDWQYWKMDTWGSHAFDSERYPDPAAMVKALHDEHIRMLISVWPKFDLHTPNITELERAGAMYPPVIPYVYPKGQGKWYDPFNPTARRIYWQQISRQLFTLGIDGWWLDGSEVELGGNWGEFRDYDTGAGPGAEVFNAYPLLHTTAVHDGQRAETDRQRVVILTRSAYAGQQRNSAITWSGDILGSWEVFARQIPAGLNFSLSGIPYWNTDIGGFFRGDEKSYPELFARWFQFGAFCPMFRVHGTGPGKEFWQWDARTQKIWRTYVDLRYRLLPYIYSTSWQVTQNGRSMMRPLAMDFPTDAHALTVSDQYLFGPGLMVCPVTQPGATKRGVHLPGSAPWFDFWTGKSQPGGREITAAAPLETLPLFVPSGTILPLGPYLQFTDEKPADPLELRIYAGADGAFTLYEDDGTTYDYERGAFASIPFTWNDRTRTLTIGARIGTFPGMLKTRVIRVIKVAPDHGAGVAPTAKADRTITYDGSAQTIPL